MKFGSVALIVGAFALVPDTLVGAQPASDWPCVQRKVDEIALAAAWQGPEIDAAKLSELRKEPDVVKLVQLLAARRTSEQEARKAIAEFSATAGDRKKEKLSAVVLGLFDSINAERADVIAGIERFGRKLKGFAEQVREANAKLDTMRADTKADPTKLNEMVQEVEWELRVFDERQRSLRFVCEVPVLIEQRLFLLSRLIQAAMS